MKAEEYNLDFTVTLTAEDSKFTDEAVAAGVPLIVVCMFRDALCKLVAAEREACASIEVHLTTPDRDYTTMSPLDAYEIALIDAAMAFREAIRARGQG